MTDPKLCQVVPGTAIPICYDGRPAADNTTCLEPPFRRIPLPVSSQLALIPTASLALAVVDQVDGHQIAEITGAGSAFALPRAPPLYHMYRALTTAAPTTPSTSIGIEPVPESRILGLATPTGWQTPTSGVLSAMFSIIARPVVNFSGSGPVTLVFNPVEIVGTAADMCLGIAVPGATWKCASPVTEIAPRSLSAAITSFGDYALIRTIQSAVSPTPAPAASSTATPPAGPGTGPSSAKKLPAYVIPAAAGGGGVLVLAALVFAVLSCRKSDAKKRPDKKGARELKEVEPSIIVPEGMTEV